MSRKYAPTTEELSIILAENQLRHKQEFEDLCNKYSSLDPDYDMDEIDLNTYAIVKNSGYLRRMKRRRFGYSCSYHIPKAAKLRLRNIMKSLNKSTNNKNCHASKKIKMDSENHENIKKMSQRKGKKDNGEFEKYINGHKVEHTLEYDGFDSWTPDWNRKENKVVKKRSKRRKTSRAEFSSTANAELLNIAMYKNGLYYYRNYILKDMQHSKDLETTELQLISNTDISSRVSKSSTSTLFEVDSAFSTLSLSNQEDSDPECTESKCACSEQTGSECSSLKQLNVEYSTRQTDSKCALLRQSKIKSEKSKLTPISYGNAKYACIKPPDFNNSNITKTNEMEPHKLQISTLDASLSDFNSSKKLYTIKKPVTQKRHSLPLLNNLLQPHLKDVKIDILTCLDIDILTPKNSYTKTNIKEKKNIKNKIPKSLDINYDSQSLDFKVSNNTIRIKQDEYDTKISVGEVGLHKYDVIEGLFTHVTPRNLRRSSYAGMKKLPSPYVKNIQLDDLI